MKPDYLKDAAVEEPQASTAVITQLDRLAKEILDLEADVSYHEGEVKKAKEEINKQKSIIQTLLSENMLIEATTASGVRITTHDAARAKITDWKALWNYLGEENALALVGVEFAGHLREVVEEYIGGNAGELSDGDVTLKCPWARMQSYLKEVAYAKGVDLTEVRVPGLDINAWTDVRLKQK